MVQTMIQQTNHLRTLLYMFGINMDLNCSQQLLRDLYKNLKISSREALKQYKFRIHQFFTFPKQTKYIHIFRVRACVCVFLIISKYISQIQNTSKKTYKVVRVYKSSICRRADFINKPIDVHVFLLVFLKSEQEKINYLISQKQHIQHHQVKI